MFGYLLIARDNSVVLMDGDVEFLKHVASRVEVEILDASECASTSSGICSDIDSRSLGLLPVWQRKKSFYKVFFQLYFMIIKLRDRSFLESFIRFIKIIVMDIIEKCYF